jgi:hypothetical protein
MVKHYGSDTELRKVNLKVSSIEMSLKSCKILQECCEKNLYTRCIQKFPDWSPGARTANDTALCP